MSGSQVIRVLHVITGLNVGGAEMMLYKLLSCMDRERFHCEVISLTELGPMATRIAELGIPVRALRLSPSRPNPFAFFTLLKWIAAFRPHVLQTWLYHADLLGGLAGKVVGGFPIVWGIRHGDITIEGNKRAIYRVAKVCAALSRHVPTRILCCSEVARASHITLGYAEQRMRVIPNGFDISAFKPHPEARSSLREELGLGPEVLLVGLVGRFDPLKDHQNFVAAATYVLQHAPEVRFVLCGVGVTPENQELMAWISQSGAPEAFHLLGPRSDVARITAALDIATSSSRTEGFSNTIGEAMASAVPCVVTNVGDSAMIVGDCGHVVPPRDPEALGNALLDLVKLGKEERARLGRSARERIEVNFSLPLIVRRYENHYQELSDYRSVRTLK